MKIIPTALTANYVHDWTTKQAIKEAMQNIVYGANKMNSVPNICYVDGIGIMEDNYIGLQKKHLYMGESEQRNDLEDGLGTFGEGLKMFLLIFARNGLYHKVDTVGFSFWGRMNDTEDGVSILEIVVEDNEREIGTRVTVQCSEEDFKFGTDGFAIMQGINKEQLSETGLIPNRYGELYVKGVRIENNETSNPLGIEYAYNIKDTSITNRDRTTVHNEKVYNMISAIWASQSDENLISEFISKAYHGNTAEDVQRGASGINISYENRKIWIKSIAKLMQTSEEKLVISSRDIVIDREAMYRGYVIVTLPDKWQNMLSWIGIKNAYEVVQAKFSEMNEVSLSNLSDEEYNNFKRAKINTKKAFKLNKVSDIPCIKIVDEIKDIHGVTNANGMYETETKIIYIKRNQLEDERFITRTLIHETMHHVTGACDNSEWFTRGFEDAILNLLGY